VYDTEKAKPGIEFSRRFTKLDFPEPEGAEITITLP
jgi:hypothetical protein